MYGNDCLCIIGCSKDKGDSKGKAADLYIGSNFKIRKKYASEHFTNWVIFSGKYGILDPDEIIEPYNLNLEDVDPAERVEVFQRAQATIQSRFPDCTKFYLILNGVYGELSKYLPGEVIFPTKGLKGRAVFHFLNTGKKEHLDVDTFLAEITSGLIPAKGYQKRYLVSLIRDGLPEYSSTYIQRVFNCAVVGGNNKEPAKDRLRDRSFFELHDGLYYLVGTYKGADPYSANKKLF